MVRYAARMEELASAPLVRRIPLAVSIGNRLISPEVIDCAFRWHGAAGLANGVLDRLAPVGLPRADGAATLARIRSWAAWPEAWSDLADAYLHAADSASDAIAHRDALHAAALAVHAAQLLVYEPVERKRALAHRAAALYRLVAPLRDPPSERIELTFRGARIPGYLALPPVASPSHPAPLVLFFNGGSTVKEELDGWREPFLAAGMATLALDNPGTGETWEATRFTPNQGALLDDVRRLVATRPALDGRIALVGVSLGGMLAVHLGAETPDLAAVVTITTPFEPAEYITRMPVLTQWEVVHVTGFPMDCQPYICAAMGLARCAPRLRMPLLVVGAGKDRVVPPDESRRLYDATTPPRALHWYPRASHCCFSHLEMMLANTARWLQRATSNEQ
ncbi:MAG: alpha/beta fold hydrolase [Chloroflexota bacterium]|nr:alpha/beta fold hydrolase [Chloroflexota bacterium]